MQIPLISYEGYLKQFRFSQLNEKGRAVCDWAFPGYNQRKSEDQLEENAAKLINQGANYVYTHHNPPRRYASFNMPRSRYYSIVEGPDGDDGGTLMREMYAYCHWELGFTVHIFDCATIEPDDLGHLASAYKGAMNAIGIVFYTHKNDSGPLAELELMEPPQDGMFANVVYCPYSVEAVHIENVLDLRQADAQQWFFDYFISDEFASASFRVENGFRPRCFTDMLPILMQPTPGGGPTDEAVGVWLAGHGVNALIYPSARSNTAVRWEDGQVISSFGWCLLDLRDLDFPLNDVLCIGDPWDLGDCTAFDLRFIIGGPNHGSWWVQGPQQYLEAKIEAADKQLFSVLESRSLEIG